MIIWLALCIPILAVIVLGIFFTKKVTFLEYLLIFGVPALTIVIAKVSIEKSQVIDKEYWNSYAMTSNYYEEWDEWIDRTCSREDCSGSGDDRTCTTEYYDCSYRDYHPQIWEVCDNLGQHYSINSNYFEFLCRTWSNKVFRDMHRDYYHIDGDAYFTNFDNQFDHLIPISAVHHYENRVQASHSVFNFQEIDTATLKAYKLFEYPSESIFDFNSILGYNDSNASIKLQKWNGWLGYRKQVQMFILVFNDKPYDAAVAQEMYWKGGNKNEFTLCIGIKNKKIRWTKVISWTEVEDLKIRVARTVKEMDSLDMVKIVDYMAGEVDKNFKRKRFRDFNYLTVEPSGEAVTVTFILTFLITMAVSIYSVANEYEVRNESKRFY